MGKYNGIVCEHCKKAFTDDDDIVVCPHCGAPHHRECYNELGHCALEEKHGSGFEWKPTCAAGSASAQNQSASVICPNCSSANLPGSRYCCMCQHPLSDTKGHAAYGRYDYSAGERGCDEYEAPESAEFSVNGVDSNELIAYTGNSFYYYIRQFRLVLRGKWGISWNWAALIFGGFYFLYRKMYKIAALLFAFHIVTILPTLFCFFGDTDASMELMNGITVFYNSQLLSKVSPFAFFFEHIGTVINIFCALFANKFYLSSAVENINRYRQSSDTEQNTKEYYDGLYYLGKPSFIPIILVAAAMLLFYSYCGTMMTYTIL